MVCEACMFAEPSGTSLTAVTGDCDHDHSLLQQESEDWNQRY
jgi:hypothetical protein